MKRFLLSAILVLASLQAYSQTATSSVFVGEGGDDAQALAAMVSSVASAYSHTLSRPVALTYSDELCQASHKEQIGGKSVRSISRAEVEALFAARRRKADQLVREADAIKASDPAKARLYYHWARAFYSSIPGNNGRIVSRLEAELASLSSYPFPKTSANNIGRKAESIYAVLPIRPAAKEEKKDARNKSSATRADQSDYHSKTIVTERVDEKEEAQGTIHIQELIEPLEGHLPPPQTYASATTQQLAARASEHPSEANHQVESSRSQGHLLLMAGAQLIPDITGTLTLGYRLPVKVPVGAYCSLSSNYRKARYDYTCTSDYMLPDGGMLWSSGRALNSCWSVTAGAFYTPLLSGHLGLYCGAGYGSRSVILEDVDGGRALVSDASGAGARYEFGAMAFAGPVSFSLGTALGAGYSSLRLGIGLLF